jgi:hypothetical protein
MRLKSRNLKLRYVGKCLYLLFGASVFVSATKHILVMNNRKSVVQAGRSRVRFPIVSLEYFIDLILPATLWPWSRLSL